MYSRAKRAATVRERNEYPPFRTALNQSRDRKGAIVSLWGSQSWLRAGFQPALALRFRCLPGQDS